MLLNSVFLTFILVLLDVYDAALIRWNVARPEGDWFGECWEPWRRVLYATKALVLNPWFEYAVCEWQGAPFSFFKIDRGCVSSIQA